MIGQLKGLLLEKNPPQLLIDVHGVGYEVDAPFSTFSQLPALGEVITLLTHVVIREDAQQLYGFYTARERTLFRLLLKVNGIGPRLGLNILSSIEIDDFIHYVICEDSSGLSRLPGIGKKTAERLIIEMREPLSQWLPLKNKEETKAVSPAASRLLLIREATSALVALGYKPQEATRLIAQVDNGECDQETLIRQALRESIA